MTTKNSAKRKRNNRSSASTQSPSFKAAAVEAVTHISKKSKKLPSTNSCSSSSGTPQGHGKIITKKDHDAAVAALQQVNWGNVVNTSRRNVIPEDAPRTKQGGKGRANKAFCHSFILGYVYIHKFPTINKDVYTHLNAYMHLNNE